jgi:hypothetical protein
VRAFAGGTGPDNVETIQERMQRARWRVRCAAYGGPEWDAAVGGLEELERELRRIRRRTRPVALPMGAAEAS